MLSYKLFLEKSSLSQLNLTKEVIKFIQRNYEIPNNAEWQKINHKYEIESSVHQYTDHLFIELDRDGDRIKVYGCVFDKEKKYFLDRFKLIGDIWGGDWEVEDREILTMTGMLSNVLPKNDIFKLKDGYSFQYKKFKERKIDELDAEFENFTEDFKSAFMTMFNPILQKMYGKQSDQIMKVIVENLSRVNVSGLSPDDIRDILEQNVNLAKKSEYLKSRADIKDPIKLASEDIQYNSLTIFDEYLFTFEDKVSEAHDEFWHIEDICEKFTTQKTMTAFMYFLYAGELMI